jgi:hypothetical protein
VVVPKELSDKQRAAMEAFAEEEKEPEPPKV